MQKIFALFVTLLTTSCVVQNSEAGANPETENLHPGVLPLILIKHANDNLTVPKTMDSHDADKDGYLTTANVFYTANKDGHQIYFCGPDDTNGGNKILQYNKSLVKIDEVHCSFATNFQSPSPQVPRCIKEPEPYVRRIIVYNSSMDEDVDLACGIEGKDGITFSFEFEACEIKTGFWSNFGSTPGKIINRVSLEMYRFCYSQEDDQVLYTEHTIKSPHILRDVRLAKDREQTFKMLTEGYQYFDSIFVTAQQKYTQLQSQSQFKEQQLVPREDFAFGLWAKPTYHYLNIKPMNNQQIKLWQYINQLIRDDAIKNDKEYRIYAGAFDISERVKEDKTDNTMADIWIKIIHHKFTTPKPTPTGHHNSESFAVIMNNNLDHESMISSFNEICHENLCKDAFTQEFPEFGDSARCCYAGENILKYFKLQFKSDEHFIIDSFVRNTNDP